MDVVYVCGDGDATKDWAAATNHNNATANPCPMGKT
jgi:hypothetical protein